MPRMMESSFLSADDSTSLYYREYLPDGEARGIVQIVHGIAEHIGRYHDFALFLAENNFIVVAHDQLGHGKSAADEKHLGFFCQTGGWDKAVQDIHTLRMLTAARHPGLPYFILGHSMGSFLTRTYLIRFRSGVDGVIISGTGQQQAALVQSGKLLGQLVQKKYGPMYKSEFVRNLAFGSYNNRIRSPRTECDWLTRNTDIVDEYIRDPLCNQTPSVCLFLDMLGGIDFIGKSGNIKRMKKDLPVLFISGDCDPVGEYGKGVFRVYKSFLHAGMTDVTMKLYHEGRHEMLNELNRTEVFSDILYWLSGKAGK